MLDFKNTLRIDIPTELNNIIIEVGKSIYKYRRTRIGEDVSCCLIWELDMIKRILCDTSCGFSNEDYIKIKGRVLELYHNISNNKKCSSC
jgi:hypothetical protein